MYGVKEKEVDKQGRIVLPSPWRKKVLRDHKVIMIIEEDEIILVPKTNKKLSSFFKKAKISNLKPDPFENFEESLARASA